MRSRYDDLQALNAEVVVISFGTKYWAQVWLQETGVPFPLLLDQARAAYRAYGLERSLIRAWGPKNLWYYGRALWSGQRLRRLNGEDTGQLGGDFIVDQQGILRFVHPSRDPTDRPKVKTLLAVLETLY